MKQASVYITIEEYKERKLPINAVASVHVMEEPTAGMDILIYQKEEPDIETALLKISKRIDDVLGDMKLESTELKLVMNGELVNCDDKVVSEIS